MGKLIVGCTVALLSLCTVGAIICRKRKQKLLLGVDSELKLCSIVEVQELSMKQIVAHFKKESVMKVLRENKGAIAVCLKKANGGAIPDVVCCLFDGNNNQVINDEHMTTVFKCQRLGEDLLNAFGNKDMIVIK